MSKVITTRSNGTRKVVTVNREPSLTDQSQKNACDVNQIIAKYKKTGRLTHTAKKQAMYADLSEVTDLMGAYDTIGKASEAFNALPAPLRKRLNNDPTKLVDYLQDPANLEESIKLGIRQKPKPSNDVPIVEEPSVSAAATAPTNDKK